MDEEFYAEVRPKPPSYTARVTREAILDETIRYIASIEALPDCQSGFGSSPKEAIEELSENLWRYLRKPRD